MVESVETPLKFFSFSSQFAGGQCYVSDSGSQESDEFCGVHCESLLCGLHQVPEVSRNAKPQHARHLLEDESSRKEAAGQAREARRRSDQQSEAVLSKEARQPCAGPERVQSNG